MGLEQSYLRALKEMVHVSKQVLTNQGGHPRVLYLVSNDTDLSRAKLFTKDGGK
jgi:hypothetical protein